MKLKRYNSLPKPKKDVQMLPKRKMMPDPEPVTVPERRDVQVPTRRPVSPIPVYPKVMPPTETVSIPLNPRGKNKPLPRYTDPKYHIKKPVKAPKRYPYA